MCFVLRSSLGRGLDTASSVSPFASLQIKVGRPLQGSDTDSDFPAAKVLRGLHLYLGLRSSKDATLSARRLPFPLDDFWMVPSLTRRLRDEYPGNPGEPSRMTILLCELGASRELLVEHRILHAPEARQDARRRRPREFIRVGCTLPRNAL